MIAWKIYVVGEHGNLKERVVPGLHFAHAIASAGLSPSQVVKARRYWNPKSLVPKLRTKNQLIFLMKLLPYYLANAPTRSEQVFQTFAPLQNFIKKFPQIANSNQNLSERLAMLDFNPTVLTILRAGEKSGDLSRALQQAITYLHQVIEISRDTHQGIWGGLLLLAISLVVLFSVSLLSSGALDAIISAGIIEQRNFSGLVLHALDYYARHYLWTLPLAIAILASAMRRYHRSLDYLWPWSVFKSYFNILRSIRLVSVWSILEKAGLNLEQDEQLLGSAIGPARAKDICRKRNEGETFSDLLTAEYFSPTMEECCVGIASLNTASKIDMLQQLAKLLHIEREQQANKIARGFYVSGVAVALGAIVLILSGILFPIYAAGLGGVNL